MTIRTPARWLITLLVSVAVPLCCCNFEAVFQNCGSCKAPACHDAETVHCDRTEVDGCAAASDQGSQAGIGHPSPADPGPERHNCACGGDTKVSAFGGKPVAKFQPAVALCFPTDSTERVPALQTCVGMRTEAKSPLIPARSLVGLHCALIV